MRYITPEQIMRDRFRNGRRPDWSTAILCFRDRSGSDTLVRELGAEPLGYKVLWGMDECLTHQVEISGQLVGVIGRCEWGGPQTAILVEELVQLGVLNVLGLGMAGSIVENLPKGSLVIAASALTTDGTSRHYEDFRLVHPDEQLLSAAMEAAQRLRLPFRQTTAATTDAIYRETGEVVRGWAEQGAEMVTMETAPLYAASSRCGLRSIWVGHISDCLVGDRWDGWDASADDRARATAQLALHLLEAMAEQDTEAVCTGETFRPYRIEGLRWWAADEWEEAYKAHKGMWPQSTWFPQDLWRELYSEGYRYCSLLVNGRGVATAGLWPRTDKAWEVIAVGTAPRFRNRGYGKAVVSFVTQEILDAGRDAALTFRKGNTPMHRIAAALGYEPR